MHMYVTILKCIIDVMNKPFKFKYLSHTVFVLRIIHVANQFMY